MKPGVLLLLIFGLPFVVSGAFWISPWLGWPTALVSAILWVASIGLAVDLHKGKQQ